MRALRGQSAGALAKSRDPQWGSVISCPACGFPLAAVPFLQHIPPCQRIHIRRVPGHLGASITVPLDADAVWRGVPLMANIPVVPLLTTPGRQR